MPADAEGRDEMDEHKNHRSGPKNFPMSRVLLFGIMSVGCLGLLIFVGGGGIGLYFLLRKDTPARQSVVTQEPNQPTGNPTQPGIGREVTKQLDDQEKAVAAINRLGGSVMRAGNQANGPVMLVDLRGKNLTNADLAVLELLPQLQQLYLASTGITDAGLAHVKGLADLVLLDVSANTGVTDAGLENVVGLVKLQQIMFSNTGVSDQGLMHLKGLPELVQVYAGTKNLTDAGLVHLKSLTKLKALSIGYSKITDAGLANLKDMTQLTFLVLDDTQVSDDGLVHLKGLSNLETLRASRTRVTNAGASELSKALPSVNVILN
jgi:Leucine-rich repeat (LRR) protein